MIYLALSIIAICAYFIGNVNFARIVAWKKRKQDITQKGSFNPGTMNMLRVYGFRLAFLTMLGEFMKGGIPALIAGFTLNHFFPGSYCVAYFIAGLFAVIGQAFPVFYKFKGGKGLAVCAGILTFTPLWWLGLILFVLNCTMLYYTDIASVATLAFITEMGIALSLLLGVFKKMPDPYWWVSIIILWVMILVVFVSHRKNIVRLIQGKENKSGFGTRIDNALAKRKEKKSKIQNAEKEIIVEENKETIEKSGEDVQITSEEEIEIDKK